MGYTATLEFNVPAKYVSKLIGRGGSNVSQIKAKTRTRISFIALPFQKSQQLCRVEGETDGVETAKTEIQSQIAELINHDQRAANLKCKKEPVIVMSKSNEENAKFQNHFGLLLEDLLKDIKEAKEKGQVPLEPKEEPKKFTNQMTKVCPNCGDRYTGRYKKHVAESLTCNSLALDGTCLSFTRKVRPHMRAHAHSNNRKTSVSKMKPSRGIRKIAGPSDFNCDVQTCTSYDMPFYSREKLERHYKKDHAPLCMVKEKDPECAQHFWRSCGMCLKDFHNRDAFIKHRRTSNSCFLTFNRAEAAAANAKTEKTLLHFRARPLDEDDDSECSLCQSWDFASTKEFKKHLESPHGRYNCRFCDRVFNRKRQLLEHSETHFEECSRNYNFKHPMCKLCGETFEASSKLIQHVAKSRFLCSGRLCTCVKCLSGTRINSARAGSTGSDSGCDSDSEGSSDLIPNSKYFARTRTFSVTNGDYELVIGGPDLSPAGKKKKLF